MNRPWCFRLLGLALAPALLDPALVCAVSATDSPLLVYLGTYTGPISKGIYVAGFDPATGKLGRPELTAETKNPTFLAVHPNKRFLYAVNEIADYASQPQGAVSSYEVDRRSGKLTLLNQVNSAGAGPCHLAVDSSGRCLLVANYGSGSVAAFSIGRDGKLSAPVSSVQHRGSSVNHQRQEGPHAHFILPDPANRLTLACDLGLDKIMLYRLDPASALLSPVEPSFVSLSPGSGPRHLVFHPNGRLVFVLNELACTVVVMEYDAQRGTLKALHSQSTLPDGFQGNNTCAEVQIHPSGRFLYCSNRGHNSIAVFSIHPKNGKLESIEQTASEGRTPRHFTFDPSGKWLLAENQDSNRVVVFAVDSRTGHLRPTGISAEVGAPVCAVFVPTE